jgi:hypothetical protein
MTHAPRDINSLKRRVQRVSIPSDFSQPREAVAVGRQRRFRSIAIFPQGSVVTGSFPCDRVLRHTARSYHSRRHSADRATRHLVRASGSWTVSSAQAVQAQKPQLSEQRRRLRPSAFLLAACRGMDETGTEAASPFSTCQARHICAIRIHSWAQAWLGRLSPEHTHLPAKLSSKTNHLGVADQYLHPLFAHGSKRSAADRPTREDTLELCIAPAKDDSDPCLRVRHSRGRTTASPRRLPVSGEVARVSLRSASYLSSQATHSSLRDAPLEVLS